MNVKKDDLFTNGNLEGNSDEIFANISHVIRMSDSGYIDGRFEPLLHQYVVSLSKTLSQHYFSRLSCQMSTICLIPLRRK